MKPPECVEANINARLLEKGPHRTKISKSIQKLIYHIDTLSQAQIDTHTLTQNKYIIQ